MSEKIEKGKEGEQLATDFLIENGYEILERNWRFSRAEIDIIAAKEDFLIFVEVKTRKSLRYGPPETAVNRKKQRLMAQCASVYGEASDHQGQIRFDIVSIIMPVHGKTRIRHIPDAFFPGLF